jgi:hypothetical protein
VSERVPPFQRVLARQRVAPVVGSSATAAIVERRKSTSSPFKVFAAAGEVVFVL